VVVGTVGLLASQDYGDGGLWLGDECGAQSVGGDEGMVAVGPFPGGDGGLVGGVQDEGVEFGRQAALEGETDHVVAGAPPCCCQCHCVGVADELGIGPVLSVVMGVVLSQGVVGLAVENVNFSAIRGDGTGTGAVRGDLRPLVEGGRVVEVYGE
jgi:hypothetical protein